MSKIIQLISGKEYLIEDEEAEYLKTLIRKEKKFIELTNGEMINVSSISVIGETDKVPFWGGYPLSKDKRGYSFMRNSIRVYLEAHNFSELEYKDDPKYSTMPKVSLIKLLE